MRWIINLWSSVSYLGADGDIDDYRQKSTILLNRLLVSYILFFLILSPIAYFNLGTPIAFLIAGFNITLAFVFLLLNGIGKSHISKHIIPVLFPLAIALGSAYIKSLWFTNELVLYLAPKLILAAMIALPVVLFGYAQLRQTIVHTIIAIIIFFGYEKINIAFGINIKELNFYPENYNLYIVVLVLVVVFLFACAIFLQHLNIKYEKKINNANSLLRASQITIEDKNRALQKTNEELQYTNTKLNQMNEELETTLDTISVQNSKLFSQKLKIEKIHQEVNESIDYARLIQNAVMSENILPEIFSESFIINKPKDVVSGDFYWMKKINNRIILATADCTGHGVPGAFMSMLGTALFNEIVNEQNIAQPNLILNNLRTKLKQALHQTGKFNESKDGIDVSLCTINTDSKVLTFSGANRSIYIIRQTNDTDQMIDMPCFKKAHHKDFTLCQIKGNTQPIGINYKEKPFEMKTIQLAQNDCLYTFTDGYTDQFGSKNNRKLMTGYLKNILLKHCHLHMSKQQEKLEDVHEEWKGHQEQTDDVLFVGIRI
jgi:serine phosphatase RsbU (regulator of sigma subunit)